MLNKDNATLIVISDLHFQYPHKNEASLSHFNLTIPQGSLFGLLGPNGAGKTTLINILAGLLPYQQGTITINGHTLHDRQSHNRSALSAYVPQHLAFYPKLSILENLRFFAAALNIDKQQIPTQIEHVLQLSQLQAYRSTRAGTLSGGVQRRLNMAIGLLNSPKLLFLDEPTAGVDAQSRHFILNSIQEINALGTTIIYTSHYMEEIETLCDRIAIIDNGSIVLQGTIEDLLRHRQSILVKTTTAPSHAQLQHLLQLWPNSSYKNGNFLIPINNQEDIQRIAQQACDNHIGIAQLTYGAKNLEALFLDKTHRTLRD